MISHATSLLCLGFKYKGHVIAKAMSFYVMNVLMMHRSTVFLHISVEEPVYGPSLEA